jgi:hypothetical protein
MKVSIVIPAIRPEGAALCAKLAKQNAGIPDDDLEIIVQEDVDRIGCPKMVKAMVEESHGEWVCFLGDDTKPLNGFILFALEASKVLQDGWGLVGLNDGVHDGNVLATHWMGNKNLLPLIGGEFFHTGYRHCFCDQELMSRSIELGRYIWADDALIIHDHPAARGESIHGTDYEWQYRPDNFHHDRRLFNRRKEHGWK